jgi:hypothetical protein
MKTRKGDWGKWLTQPEDGTFGWPAASDGQIRFAPAGKPFEDWERPSQNSDLRMKNDDGDRDAAPSARAHSA